MIPVLARGVVGVVAQGFAENPIPVVVTTTVGIVVSAVATPAAGALAATTVSAGFAGFKVGRAVGENRVGLMSGEGDAFVEVGKAGLEAVVERVVGKVGGKAGGKVGKTSYTPPKMLSRRATKNERSSMMTDSAGKARKARQQKALKDGRKKTKGVEHTKGKRPSTKGDHEKAAARKARDRNRPKQKQK